MKRILIVLLFLATTNVFGFRDEFALEKFELNTLEVKRIISKEKCRFAYVKASDGALYLLTIGDYVGKNNGMVVRIESNAVFVNELVRAGNSPDWTTRQIRMEVKE